MIVALLASSLVLLADTTAVPAVAASEAKPTVAKSNDKDKVVCHNETTVGSRLPKRVCMLQSQIDSNRQSGRDELDKLQRGVRGPAGN